MNWGYSYSQQMVKLASVESPFFIFPWLSQRPWQMEQLMDHSTRQGPDTEHDWISAWATFVWWEFEMQWEICLTEAPNKLQKLLKV